MLQKTYGEVLQKVEAGEFILRLTSLVIAECCWVLVSFYEADHKDISDALLKFTNSFGVEAEEKEVVQQALRNYAEKMWTLLMLI